MTVSLQWFRRYDLPRMFRDSLDLRPEECPHRPRNHLTDQGPELRGQADGRHAPGSTTCRPCVLPSTHEEDREVFPPISQASLAIVRLNSGTLSMECRKRIRAGTSSKDSWGIPQASGTACP